MKTQFIPILVAASISTVSASPAQKKEGPPKRGAPIYLACTGITPFWLESWGTSVIGMTDDHERLVIKLTPDGSTATARFAHVGEQTFELTTDGEYYQGRKRLDVRSLDGRIVDMYLSINRITGNSNAGYTVTNSPNDGMKVAFLGECVKASAQF